MSRGPGSTLDVALRRMRWWDVAAVAAIEADVFGGDRPWSPEQFWAELAGVPDRRFYVVAAEPATDLVVGYAGIAWPDAASLDPADVMTVAVARGHARRGVGTLLVRQVLAAADERGVAEVLLEVRADNVAAQHLYRAAGFVELARRRGYYPGGVDGLVMRRRRRGPGDGPGDGPVRGA